jgi:hypothetical protein
MKTRKSGYYEEYGQNWQWPKDTWFQGRLNYIRQQQPSRILKSCLEASFLPYAGNLACDPVKEQKMAEIDSFHSQERNDLVTALIARRLDDNLSDRERKLCNLLTKVTVNGPAAYGEAVDQLRSFCNFTDTQKAILRELFILGVKSGEKGSRQDQVWAYQRLLSRLLLNQPVDQSIPRSVAGAPPMNQRHAPIYEPKPEGLRISNISLHGLVKLHKEQYSIYLNRYRYLSETIGKTAVIAVRLLIISPMLYLLFVHYQKPNDIAVAKKAVLPPVHESVPAPDKVIFPQPAEVITADVQAKPMPPLHIGSSTDVPEQTARSRQPLVEPKISEMIVTARTNPTQTKAASTIASNYKTIRIAPLRQEPRFAAAITKDIDSGTVVTVFEIKGDWLKIKIEGANGVGYVRKEYVVPVS